MHVHHAMLYHEASAGRSSRLSAQKSFMKRVVSHDSILQNGRLQLPLKKTLECAPSIPIRSPTPQRKTDMVRVTSVPANMRPVIKDRRSRNEIPSRILRRSESKVFSKIASFPTLVSKEPPSRPGIHRQRSSRNFVFPTDSKTDEKFSRVSSVPLILATRKPYGPATTQADPFHSRHELSPEPHKPSNEIRRSPLKASIAAYLLAMHRTDDPDKKQALGLSQKNFLSRSFPNLISSKARVIERELSSSDFSIRSKSPARTQSSQFMPSKPKRQTSLEAEGNDGLRPQNAHFNSLLLQQNPRALRKTPAGMPSGDHSAWKQNQMILLNQQKQNKNISSSGLPVPHSKKNMFLQSMIMDTKK